MPASRHFCSESHSFSLKSYKRIRDDLHGFAVLVKLQKRVLTEWTEQGPIIKCNGGHGAISRHALPKRIGSVRRHCIQVELVAASRRFNRDPEETLLFSHPASAIFTTRAQGNVGMY